MKKLLYNIKMHQGLPARIIIAVALLFPFFAVAQLNTSDEIIQTIEDIPIEDDSSEQKQEEILNRPQFDEEFSSGKLPVEEPPLPLEDEEELTETPVDREIFDEDLVEEGFGTVDGPEKEEPSYEEELEKNAEQVPERREISPEDLRNFEVDPIKQAEPQPTEVLEPTELQEEIVVKPEAPAGPVIVYENEKRLSEDQAKQLTEKTKIEIEPDPYAETSSSYRVGDYLKSFKERRPSWTYQIEIGGSDYNPVNYISEIINSSGSSFETFYETADVPMPTFGLEFKKNFSWMAISLGLGGSYYLSTYQGAELQMLAPYAKLTVYLDTLFDEPYIVPYATAGYAYFQFDETDSVTGFEYTGASDNFFVSAGLLFQLDWLDPIADRIALTDNGIENTFVYLDVRTYLDTGIKGIYEDAEVIGDFSSLTHFGAGIKIEF